EEIRPASFLDIGTSAQANKIAVVLNIVLNDQNVKSILVNIFGGFTPCDEIAQGMLEALNEVHVNRPLVIRFGGLSAEEGRALIDRANIPNQSSAATLTKAVLMAIEAAKENLYANPD